MVTHGPQLDIPLSDGVRHLIELIDRFPWEQDLGDAMVELTGAMTTRKVWHEPAGVVGAIVPWNDPFTGLPATCCRTIWPLASRQPAAPGRDDQHERWRGDRSRCPLCGYEQSGVARQNGQVGFTQYLEVTSVAWPAD